MKNQKSLQDQNIKKQQQPIQLVNPFTHILNTNIESQKLSQLSIQQPFSQLKAQLNLSSPFELIQQTNKQINQNNYASNLLNQQQQFYKRFYYNTENIQNYQKPSQQQNIHLNHNYQHFQHKTPQPLNKNRNHNFKDFQFNYNQKNIDYHQKQDQNSKDDKQSHPSALKYQKQYFSRQAQSQKQHQSYLYNKSSQFNSFLNQSFTLKQCQYLIKSKFKESNSTTNQFYLVTSINQVLYNEKNSLINCIHKDVILYDDDLEYLKRMYHYNNLSTGNVEISHRIKLFADFYATKHSIGSFYPTMILTKTFPIIMKRFHRVTKTIDPQDTSIMFSQQSSSKQKDQISKIAKSLIFSQQFNFQMENDYTKILQSNIKTQDLQNLDVSQNNDIDAILKNSYYDLISHNIYEYSYSRDSQQENQPISPKKKIEKQINYFQKINKNSVRQTQSQLSHLICDINDYDIEDMLQKYNRYCKQNIQIQSNNLNLQNSQKEDKVKEKINLIGNRNNIKIREHLNNYQYQQQSKEIQNYNKLSFKNPQNQYRRKINLYQATQNQNQYKSNNRQYHTSTSNDKQKNYYQSPISYHYQQQVINPDNNNTKKLNTKISIQPLDSIKSHGLKKIPNSLNKNQDKQKRYYHNQQNYYMNETNEKTYQKYHQRKTSQDITSPKSPHFNNYYNNNYQPYYTQQNRFYYQPNVNLQNNENQSNFNNFKKQNNQHENQQIKRNHKIISTYLKQMRNQQKVNTNMNDNYAILSSRDHQNTLKGDPYNYQIQKRKRIRQKAAELINTHLNGQSKKPKSNQKS